MSELLTREERTKRLTMVRDSMLTGLRARLDPAIAAKLTTPVVREVVSVLAEWVLDNDLGRLSTKAESKQRPASALEAHRQREIAEAVRPAVEQSSFLDALDEIR